MAKLKTVRVVKTKYSTYALHYINPDGRRRRLSIGSDQNLAQRLAVKFNDWLLEGKDPEIEIERAQRSEIAQSITVREFFPIFMERHGIYRRPTMQDSYRNRFKALCRCPQLVDSALGLVSKKLVLDYINARLIQDKVACSTVHNEGSLLKKMFACAADWEFLNVNTLQGLKLPRVSNKRAVYVSQEQIGSLLQELPNGLADVVEFAVYSGFRKDNVLELRIEELNFHDLTETAEATLIVKGGRKAKLPLGPLAIEVLQRVIDNRKSGYVFLNPITGRHYRSIHKTFDRAVRKVSITVDGTKLRFHDLRHIFATWLHNA